MNATAVGNALNSGLFYEFEIVGLDGNIRDAWTQKNRIPNEGLEFLLKAPFGDTAQIPNFYVFCFVNNFVPTANTGAADLASAGEWLDYSDAARQAWAYTFATGASLLPTDAQVIELTATADSLIYGGGLISTSAKGSPTGTLLSILRLSTAKQVMAGEVLRIRAGLTYISAS